METHRDTQGFPAVVVAFGWGKQRGATKLVLAMRSGRVDLFRVDDQTFQRSYRDTGQCREEGQRELEALSRVYGSTLEARRLLCFSRTGYGWKVAAIDFLLQMRSRFQPDRDSVWKL